MAVIEVDARPLGVIFDCPQCGPPAELTDPRERENPAKLAEDHKRATGHKPSFRQQGRSYITLIIGPSRQVSGPMPLG